MFGEGEILTTDYTDLHGWKWWDLFLSYFDGRVEHKEHKDFFWGGGVHSHFMKSECGVCFIGVGDGSSHFS